MNSKLLKFLIFAAILGVYAAFSLNRIALPNNDMGVRLKIGEVTMETRTPPRTNLFSYTEPDQPFINRYWLHGMVFYFVHAYSGFKGLVLFKAAVLLTAFIILFLSARKRGGFWLCTFLSLPVIIILRERTDIRPEIFTYLFIAVHYYFLLDAEDHPEGNRLFWLVPCQALWANLHLFFPLGMLFPAGLLLERLVRAYADRTNPPKDLLVKKLLLLLLLLAGASCCTQDGLRTFPEFFATLHKSGFYPVGENEPISRYLAAFPELSPSLWTYLLALLVFIVIAGRTFWARLRASFSVSRALAQLPLFCCLACAGGAAAGFAFRRGITLFALTLLPALAACLSLTSGGTGTTPEQSPPAKARLPLWARTAGFAALFSYFMYLGFTALRAPDFGIGLTAGSEGAAEFFKAQSLKGPIFNNYNIGGYLIYNLYPAEKVFMDVRGGDAYSLSFFKTVYRPMLRHYRVWLAMLEKYDFNALFFDYEDKYESVRYFITARAADPDWAMVYADKYSVIFLRSSRAQNKAVIDKYRIDSANIGEKTAPFLLSKDPEDWVRAADLCNLFRRWDLARAIFKKVLAEHPDSGVLWLVAGETEVTATDEESLSQAVTYLQKALSLGRRDAETYSFLGLAYIKAGDKVKARAALEKALDYDPNREDAVMLLAALDKNAEIELRPPWQDPPGKRN